MKSDEYQAVNRLQRPTPEIVVVSMTEKEIIDSIMDKRSAFQRSHVCVACLHNDCAECTGSCNFQFQDGSVCMAKCICLHTHMRGQFEVSCTCGYAELCSVEYTAIELGSVHVAEGPEHEVTVQRLNSKKEIS